MAKFKIGDHVRIIIAKPAPGLPEPPVGAEGYVLENDCDTPWVSFPGHNGKYLPALGARDGDAFVMDEEQLELIP